MIRKGIADGSFDPTVLEIAYDPELKNGAKWHTLLHEVIEVINIERGLELEHRQIDQLAGALVTAGLDNGWCWPFSPWKVKAADLVFDGERMAGDVFSVGDDHFACEVADGGRFTGLGGVFNSFEQAAMALMVAYLQLDLREDPDAAD